MKEYEIIVRFGSGVPADEQGRAMLAMERGLRERGVPAEVFKETMPDDVKRRSAMTIEERAKL